MTLTMTKTGTKVCDIITGLALVAYTVLMIAFSSQPFSMGHAVITAALTGVMLVSYMLKTFYKHNLIVDVVCISVIIVMFIVPFTQILTHMA